MGKKDQIRALRKQGLTYRKIAEQFGCSYQYVAQVCGRKCDYRFSTIKDTCIYPNLRKWMNDNRISRAEFVRRMGLMPETCNISRFGNVLLGKHYPRKPYIDLMIKVTGMPYEVLFKGKTK